MITVTQQDTLCPRHGHDRDEQCQHCKFLTLVKAETLITPSADSEPAKAQRKAERK